MVKDYSNTAKLNRWARKFLFPFDSSEPKVKTLRVSHRAANGKLADIGMWELAGLTEDAWKQTASEVNDGLLDDAEGNGGVQTYICSLLNAEGEQISRLPLRVAASTDDDEDETSSEPATSKGMLAQMMRHNEALHRTTIGSFANILRASQEQNGALTILVEKMTEKHLEYVTRVENLANEQNQRDLATKEVEASIENRGAFVQQFLALLGPIAKKITGSTPDGMLPPEVLELKSLLSGLDQEQVDQLKMVLTPAQCIVLFSLMEKNATPKNGQSGEAKPE